MPELPEVETIRRGLEERIVGDAIRSADVRYGKMFIGKPKDVIGSPITGIRRVAKVLIIDFKNGNSLLIHFKLTGQLVYFDRKEKDIAIGGHPEKAYEQPLPHKHTHIIYHLKSGAALYYNDLRKFGWHKVVKAAKIADTLGKEFAGIDILDHAFTLDFFRKYLLQRPKRPVKEVIMDQRYLAGLGNIYAAEALWQAKIRPDRAVKSLTGKEQSALYRAIHQVITLSIKHGGSTFNSYVDAAGRQGTFMKHAAVYQQKQDPKGHEVKRMKQGGRTTHYCPLCQK